MLFFSFCFRFTFKHFIQILFTIWHAKSLKILFHVVDYPKGNIIPFIDFHYKSKNINSKSLPLITCTTHSMEPYKRLSSLLNHPRVRTSIIGPLINCVLYYARLVAPHLCTYFMFKMKYLINLRVRLVLVFFLMEHR